MRKQGEMKEALNKIVMGRRGRKLYRESGKLVRKGMTASKRAVKWGQWGNLAIVPAVLRTLSLG